jgi:hypothetical protein
MILNLSGENFSKKIFHRYWLYVIAAILLLQACGNSAEPGPRVNVVTASPTPTATTAAPAPDRTPTSVVSSASLQSYTHTSNRFRLGYPATWKLVERPDGVILLEPTAKAGYSVVFSDVGKTFDAQELNQYLLTFVAQNFAGEGSNFQPIHQEQAADGTVTVEFGWSDPHLGPTISQLRLFQKDTIVFILHISTAKEQWQVSRKELERLSDTFTPLDTHPEPTVQPPEPPPSWALIGPESKEFGFFYASDWEVLEQSHNSVSVTLSSLGLTFTASNFSWPRVMEDTKAAEKAALAHLEMLRDSYDDVQHLPPGEFPLDTATGSTIDFIYTAGDGTSTAGSVITAAHKGKMHKIVFTAPAEVYDAALQWFNPMYKSFKFLSPDDTIFEEP